MTEITRRTFVEGAIGASAILAGCTSMDQNRKQMASDRISLGESGVAVPRVAMGSGTNGWRRASDQTRLGTKKYARLLKHGVERGAAFIDAADLYGCHELVKRALHTESIPRDKVTILSKVWYATAPEMTPTTTAKPEVERFLRELGVDVIDICLIHCVVDPRWPDQLERMRDDLSELKEKGIVRAVGCSCHSHAALKTAVEHPWTDVVLARINPRHQRMDDDGTVDETAAVLRTAVAMGKGVLGMKLFGGGDLSSPEEREKSLRLAFGSGLIHAGTIGFTSPGQVDEAMDRIDRILAS